MTRSALRSRGQFPSVDRRGFYGGSHPDAGGRGHAARPQSTKGRLPVAIRRSLYDSPPRRASDRRSAPGNQLASDASPRGVVGSGALRRACGFSRSKGVCDSMFGLALAIAVAVVARPAKEPPYPMPTPPDPARADTPPDDATAVVQPRLSFPLRIGCCVARRATHTARRGIRVRANR